MNFLATGICVVRQTQEEVTLPDGSISELLALEPGWVFAPPLLWGLITWNWSRCWQWRPGLLKETSVLLTTETYLQSPLHPTFCLAVRVWILSGPQKPHMSPCSLDVREGIGTVDEGAPWEVSRSLGVYPGWGPWNGRLSHTSWWVVLYNCSLLPCLVPSTEQWDLCHGFEPLNDEPKWALCASALSQDRATRASL